MSSNSRRMSLSHELNPSILWDEKLAQLVQQSVLEMVFILFKLSCYFLLQLLIYLSKIDITHVLFLINFMSEWFKLHYRAHN
uniref:Uncharacterized protein n=1 Tax=Picea glauca TaxID=3330 RepID=A0A117NI45_PICGL|nr:hypothetical protein ABT39_MTgene3937 [Picea glauca]QHR91053.1 hypothetical protein Q903MT_gene5085 [Picea sitchensis]